MSPRNSSLLLAFVLLFARGGLGADPDAITITKAQPVIERKTFDPANKPKDMPALTGNEAAVAVNDFSINSEAEFSQTAGAMKAKVEAVSMKLTLRVTIWNPKGASAALKEHEEGHRRISEHFYTDAEVVARDLAKEYIGRTIDLDDPSPESLQRATNAIVNEIGRAYLQRTQTRAQQANDAYDRITDHGRNRKVTVDDAIKQVLAHGTGMSGM